jgi:hypothetical protein
MALQGCNGFVTAFQTTLVVTWVEMSLVPSECSGHGGWRRRYVRAQRAQGKGRDEGDAEREGAVRDSEREEQEAQSALALRARARNAGGGWRRQRVGGGGARRATAEQPVRNA